MMNTTMVLPQNIRNRIEEIKLDNTVGAVELAKRAAEALIVLTENLNVSSPSELIAFIAATTQAIVNAQPAMASIFNLANKIYFTIEKLNQTEEIKQAIRFSCQSFISQIENSGQAISKAASDLIKDDVTIMTYSFSSTVLSTLLLAKAAGRRFNIICSEGRPMLEGIALAKKLGQENIQVTLVIDAAIFSFLSKVNLILVGADALSVSGLINKIGTLGLAIAAKTKKIDMYALCGSEKFLPVNYQIRVDNLKDANEILTETMRNVTVANHYFDITPLEFLTAIVTDDGKMAFQEVRNRLAEFEIRKSIYWLA